MFASLPLEVVLRILLGRAVIRQSWLPHVVFRLPPQPHSKVASFAATNPYAYLADDPRTALRYVPLQECGATRKRLILQRWYEYGNRGYFDVVGLEHVHENTVSREHRTVGCGVHLNTSTMQFLSWHEITKWGHAQRNLYLR